MSTWSVDAFEALRPHGRTGIYYLEAQILACEQAADAEVRRGKAQGKATRKGAGRGPNGGQVREQGDRRGEGKNGGTPTQQRKPTEKRQNLARGGVKQDPRRLIRVDLPRTPGVLKIHGAQSPARPLPEVVEESVPSRPVGWSVTATWTGGE